jgi:hypothetical protein
MLTWGRFKLLPFTFFAIGTVVVSLVAVHWGSIPWHHVLNSIWVQSREDQQSSSLSEREVGNWRRTLFICPRPLKRVHLTARLGRSF